MLALVLSQAISAGCIPVFFHPLQPKLFPLHWNGSASSVLFDWTSLPKPLPGKRGYEPFVSHAEEAFRSLLQLPDQDVLRMQSSIRQVATRMVYHMRGDGITPTTTEDDAVDALVRGLPTLLSERGWLGGKSLG